MSRQFNELLIAQGGLRVPASAAAGKLAQSDASGNVSWVTVASLQGKTSTTFAKGDDTEYAFSAWRPIGMQRIGQLTSATAQITNSLFYYGGNVLSGANNSGICAFYLDPTDWGSGSTTSPTVGSRTLKVRFRAGVITNSVAPGVNFTFGLYPVTFSGGSNIQPIATVGTAIVTAAINAPGANTANHVEAAATNFPNAGWYALAVSTSGTNAANSVAHLSIEPQLQAV